MIEAFSEFNVILASQSPRRKMLFEALGFPFEVKRIDVNEDFSDSLKAAEIPEYLARKKSDAVRDELGQKDLLITADTVVWINDRVLNKPESMDEAKSMLLEISGQQHSVFTGVCIATPNKVHTFSEETKVYFNALSEEEIDHYLQHYKPLDKAGAYGIQEFIGLIGIQRVDGDFYNVVGFPMQRFWQEVSRFIASS